MSYGLMTFKKSVIYILNYNFWSPCVAIIQPKILLAEQRKVTRNNQLLNSSNFLLYMVFALTRLSFPFAHVIDHGTANTDKQSRDITELKNAAL